MGSALSQLVASSREEPPGASTAVPQRAAHLRTTNRTGRRVRRCRGRNVRAVRARDRPPAVCRRLRHPRRLVSCVRCRRWQSPLSSRSGCREPTRPGLLRQRSRRGLPIGPQLNGPAPRSPAGPSRRTKSIAPHQVRRPARLRARKVRQVPVGPGAYPSTSFPIRSRRDRPWRRGPACDAGAASIPRSAPCSWPASGRLPVPELPNLGGLLSDAALFEPCLRRGTCRTAAQHLYAVPPREGLACPRLRAAVAKLSRV